MSLKVEIDSDSGFCGGVIRAISGAETYLDRLESQGLLSLGPIVHNEEELARLEEKGLRCVSLQDLPAASTADPCRTLLIRAHGEAPQTYVRARELGYDIIDCTCPVVLKLQKSIKEAYERVASSGGQVVIFGKIGHAEILGLVGQVNGDAVVVENVGMLAECLENGRIRKDVPVELFSQTTKDPSEYARVCDVLRSEVADVMVHDTICAQVASRHKSLEKFSRDHDVVIFVTGRQSSNGKVLSDLCKSVNDRTYTVRGVDEISASWFKENDSVGVCGATSTPKWLLEKVAQTIENLQ